LTDEKGTSLQESIFFFTWFFWSAADGKRVPFGGRDGRDVDENVVTGLEVKVFGSLDVQVSYA